MRIEEGGVGPVADIGGTLRNAKCSVGEKEEGMKSEIGEVVRMNGCCAKVAVGWLNNACTNEPSPDHGRVATRVGGNLSVQAVPCWSRNGNGGEVKGVPGNPIV